MKETKTERLLLRNWTLEDSKDMFAYAKSDLVGPAAGWPTHKSEEESRKIIATFISDDDVLAIVHKGENRVIGSIGLHNRQPDENISVNQREIGYVLNPAYWGQGYMPEAVRGLLALGFREYGLDLIWCGHFAENDKSRRVIEKCGFSFKLKKDEAKPLLNNRVVTLLYYSISRDEYFKACAGKSTPSKYHP